jgi:hypothetical protein
MLETSKGMYDAEHAAGNNLGRYANEQNVFTALSHIKYVYDCKRLESKSKLR